MSQSVKSPIDYPRVSVGGVQYQIKFSLSAWVLLESWGMNKDVIREWFTGRTRAVTFSLAAAGLGNYDEMGNWETAGFTMTKLTDRILPEEIDGIIKAVGESLKKLSAEIAEKKAAAAPAPDSTA